MEKENDKVYETIAFSDILKMTNPLNKRNGEIAISILTPNQVIHAKPCGACPDFHGILGSEVYKDVFREYGITPSDYCIEVRYAIYSREKVIISIYMPSLITYDEYSNLNKIIAILNDHGINVTSLTTDFDPRKKNDKSPKWKGEFYNREVLAYLLTNSKVIDYELPFEENILEKTKRNVQK